MTREELIQGYETEIAYQKHMVENLGRWFSLLFVVASIGVVLIYSFKQSLLFMLILGWVLLVLGILGMLLFGYGIHRGRKNLHRVLDDYQTKLKAYPL